jgi:hypothetical protein
MSIRIKFVAAVAVGLASLSQLGPAAAYTPLCNNFTVNIDARGARLCYFLPTVAGGRVTGVAQHDRWIWINKNQPPVVHPVGCRYLPTVAGGRVVGSHQVCG